MQINRLKSHILESIDYLQYFYPSSYRGSLIRVTRTDKVIYLHAASVVTLAAQVGGKLSCYRLLPIENW